MNTTNPNVNKQTFEMPPKPINKDSYDRTKENEFFAEKQRQKFSIEEIQKRTQDRISEYFFLKK